MSLAEGLAWARVARGLSVRALVERCTHDRASTYRVCNGSVRDPRSDTLVDLCHVLRVDPTVLLQHSGVWPPSPPPADELDSALLLLLPRLEALPVAHKRWALGVVRALASGAPSGAPDTEVPQLCGYD